MPSAIVISILSTIAWWTVDRAVGHAYSSEWLRMWDAVVRLMFFSLVLFAARSVKRQRDEARARIELLERSEQLQKKRSSKSANGNSSESVAISTTESVNIWRRSASLPLC
jgi:hypothetical protein